MTTIFKIKTWDCPNCGYKTDKEPADFTICPSCGLDHLIYEEDIDQRLTIKVMGEETIDKELETPPRDILTQEDKDVYRTKREGDMNKALEEASLIEDNS